MDEPHDAIMDDGEPSLPDDPVDDYEPLDEAVDPYLPEEHNDDYAVQSEPGCRMSVDGYLRKPQLKWSRAPEKDSRASFLKNQRDAELAGDWLDDAGAAGLLMACQRYNCFLTTATCQRQDRLWCDRCRQGRSVREMTVADEVINGLLQDVFGAASG